MCFPTWDVPEPDRDAVQQRVPPSLVYGVDVSDLDVRFGALRRSQYGHPAPSVFTSHD
jgi:hypothetical protein